MENLDLINGKINTRTGILFLRATESNEKLTDTFLSIKHVKSVDELTRNEFKQMTLYINSFAEALEKKVKPGDVKFNFVFRNKKVSLGKFSNMDLTVNVIKLLDDFAPDKFDRISLFLSCIFTPLVKRLLLLTDDDCIIANELDDIILSQLPFEDAISLFFFFQNLKKISSPSSRRSLKTYIKLYQFKMNLSIFSTLLYKRRVQYYRKRYCRLMIIFQNMLFLTRMILAALHLSICVLIVLLRDWLMNILRSLRSGKRNKKENNDV